MGQEQHAAGAGIARTFREKKINRGGAEDAEMRGEDLVRLVRSKQVGHRGGEVLAQDFTFSPFFYLPL